MQVDMRCEVSEHIATMARTTESLMCLSPRRSHGIMPTAVVSATTCSCVSAEIVKVTDAFQWQ